MTSGIREEYKKRIKNALLGYNESYRSYIYNMCKKHKYICVWGVGTMGRRPKSILEEMGLRVSFYCDSDSRKTGKTDPYGYDIPCITIDELVKVKNETIVLIPTRYYKEIYDSLEKLSFPNVERLLDNKIEYHDFLDRNDRREIIRKLENTVDILEDNESSRIITRLIEEWVSNVYKYGAYDDICSEPQYFPKDLLRARSDEIFVDCGAFVGDIVDDFLRFENNTFEKYYGFELIPEFYYKFSNEVKAKWKTVEEKFVLENRGVSDSKRTIRYKPFGEGSHLDEQGSQMADVVSIDEYMNGKRVSFIKMDIEGEEGKALIGAKETIMKWHPKLAICIYHKPEDYWVIPKLIKEFCKDYKLFIRHHTDMTNETVCYAAVEEDLIR